MLREAGPGCGGVTCFGLLEFALALFGSAGEIAVFEQCQQLPLLHPGAALDVKFRDRGSDFWSEDRLLQRVHDRVGGYFQFDGAAFCGSDLDGDERRRFLFRRTAAVQEDCAGQEQDAPSEQVWFHGNKFMFYVVHGVVSTPVNVWRLARETR